MSTVDPKLGDYVSVTKKEADQIKKDENPALVHVTTGTGKRNYLVVRPKKERPVLVALHL